MLFTFEVFVNEIICLLKLNPAIFGFKTKVKNIGNIDRGCLISVKLVLQQCLVYCQCYFIYIVLLEFISFGYFCIPMVNKDLNKKKKMIQGNVIRGTVRRRNVRSGIVRSGNCPLNKCLRGTVRRGKVRRGNVRRGNVRRGTVLEPLNQGKTADLTVTFLIKREAVTCEFLAKKRHLYIDVAF